jgi:hypothetical protein
LESGTYHSQIISNHISRVPQLPSNSTIPKHRIHTLGIARLRRSLEVLYKLAHSQHFPHESELFLQDIEGCDGGGWIVGSVEVPGVEAGEVLD